MSALAPRLVTALALIAAMACARPDSDEPDTQADSNGESGTTESGTTEGDDATEGPDDWGDSLGGDETETGEEDVPLGPAVIDYETCIVDPGAPTATLTGHSSLGPFDGQYAWFGWLTCGGKAISPTLVIGESPQDLADALAIAPSSGAVPKPSIEWFLLGHCSPADGWTGEGGGGVTLRTDGPWELGYGSFAITGNSRLFDPVDPANPPTITGNLSLYEGDWLMSGEFTAVYCGALSYALDGC